MSELVRRDVPAIYEPPPQTIWIDQYLDEKGSDLARYARILAKRKWLVVAMALLVFAGVCAWTFTTKRMYTSSVNLQIDPEQNVLPYKEMYDSVTEDPRYLLTQAQVLKSEALAS